MNKDENGYIVVETVGTFIPFVLLVISILSLVNIVTMQARVHNALTQAANMISIQSYMLYSSNMSDGIMDLNNKSNEIKEEIKSVMTGIELISKGNGNLDFSKLNIQGYITGKLLQPLVEKYLANGDISGDSYLRSKRVDGIDLSESIILDNNGNIKLTVYYEIEYTFGALKLPFKPSLKVTQSAVTKAWLGGSGEGYRR